MFFAARMCHIAFVTSIDVWYSSPANRHKYIRAFKDQFRETGKPDYTAFMKTHPETISETFGDEGTSEGQMVKAIVLPSCVIMAIGGIMMRCGGSSMWGYAFHAARGLLTPFGLLMVLQTPVVSGATGGNKDRGTCLASQGLFQGCRHDRHGTSMDFTRSCAPCGISVSRFSVSDPLARPA
ncbi:dnaJ [Symbiodinium sp. CCMP2456]|nr:dnaJ [Symbiodinium sp. CCMP2456]